MNKRSKKVTTNPPWVVYGKNPRIGPPAKEIVSRPHKNLKISIDLSIEM